LSACISLGYTIISRSFDGYKLGGKSEHLLFFDRPSGTFKNVASTLFDIKFQMAIWLVVSNIFHFPSYMGESFPLTFIFFKMVIAPPTSY